MMRVFLILFCTSVIGLSLPSAAQKPAAAAGGSSSSQPAGAVGISGDQARAALDVLNDPAKRAAFTATLNAIVKAQPAAGSGAGATGDAAKPPPAETTVEGVTIPLAPDSLGAQILVSATDFFDGVGDRAIAALQTVQSLPLLYGWAVVMLTNPVARDLLSDVGWRLALVLCCAAAVEYGLRRAVWRPIDRLERMAPAVRAGPPEDPSSPADASADADAVETAPRNPPRRHLPSAWTLLNRVPLVLARLVLELVPALGMALAGHLIAASGLGGQTASRLIILAVLDAYVICVTLLCVARMLLSPDQHRLRLFHLEDTTAAYLMGWIRLMIVIAVVGYAIGEVGLLLGLSEIAHEAIQKAVGLVLHLMLGWIVLSNRRRVRRWLRAPDGTTGILARLRNGFAQVWHWVALFFLAAGWLAWAVEVPHGFTVILRYFSETMLVLIGGRLLQLLLLGVVDRVMRPAPKGSGPRTRLASYHPVVSSVVRFAVYMMCILGLLQLYGLNTFLWLFSSALGLRVLSSVGTLTVTIAMTVGIWETVNGGVQQHLDRLQRDAQAAKSARLRTLLPLLRTSLMIAIAIVAGLMILSEIGINIAPLLAGAGILGVAIGFGSQKLVQDLITGIFLLLENAMQVGDYVTVAGLSGVVEALSVRTIRLRAADGSVHLIPFSSVTSVTNVNRGLGNASVSVSVAFDEDTDRVSELLKSIIAGMRSDPALSAQMLSDFQLWGVDKVDGASVTIVGQVVCTDSGRWAVQREFNRRMKRRFQELGIRIFDPTTSIAVPTMMHASAERGNDHGHAAAAE